MFANPAWTVDMTRVLTRRELAAVLSDATKQAERSLNAQRNLIIVRLACCCGLRVSEIGALRLDDVIVDGARPHIRLRRETTKGKKARCLPLWWDAGRDISRPASQGCLRRNPPQAARRRGHSDGRDLHNRH